MGKEIQSCGGKLVTVIDLYFEKLAGKIYLVPSLCISLNQGLWGIYMM